MIYNHNFDLDSRAPLDDANGDDNKQMNHVFKKLEIIAKNVKGYFSEFKIPLKIEK